MLFNLRGHFACFLGIPACLLDRADHTPYVKKSYPPPPVDPLNIEVFFLLLVFLFTELLKLIQRVCGLRLPVIWPDEMRWWGRLLISMDNLTYFLWFWTAFFWTLGGTRGFQ